MRPPPATVRRGGHFDAADVLRIAEAATVGVGGNDLDAAAADLLHHAQGALARDLQPVFGQREAVHRRIGAPAGILDAALYSHVEHAGRAATFKCSAANRYSGACIRFSFFSLSLTRCAALYL